MTRRLALAVALAFTTVVTFALVAIGAQAGLFGGRSDGAPADAAAGQATPTAEPTVITEYRYIDVTATPSAGDSGPSSSVESVHDSRDDRAGEVRQSADSDDAEELEDHQDSGYDEHEESEHEEDDD